MDFIPAMKSGLDQHVHQALEVKGHPWELKEEKKKYLGSLQHTCGTALERTAIVTPWLIALSWPSPDGWLMERDGAACDCLALCTPIRDQHPC